MRLMARRVSIAQLPTAPHDDLRHAFIILNHSRSADVCADARQFPDILPVIPPHQNGENLLRIGGTQVDERRLSSTGRCRLLTGHFPANGGLLSHMVLRVCRRDSFGHSWQKRNQQEENQGLRTPKRFHLHSEMHCARPVRAPPAIRQKRSISE
jgi:hypothetical protein